MSIRDIARESWRDELDTFSRQHEGWLVSLTTKGPSGDVAVEAHDLPLEGVSVASPQSRDIAISVGDRSSHLTHEVRDAAAVRIDETAEQAERALIIAGNDGTTTRIEFRSPMRGDQVDGAPVKPT